ncbi:transmembrane protein, putative (macronuclear) [Tetrahymena thermophila SB210]|uniref:Transmembrane protein, putative n=1 Tax=Tetrahymena thermophila (strain SB210) TaxID=312017 RepID=Q230V0_TETTS|nr:transmembrane protein, putative [Tetrahymena thermophila SB210]EAR91189.1 transmembrane protein, putative [Tetrahymena thermophila SB210]|eukprot:XP_001011434.1 transmembrane protein, putative [Tetrahymena thermophila SB210]
MTSKTIILIAIISTLALSSLLLLNKKSSLKSDQPTIYDWQSCLQNTVLSTCDQDDDPLDVDECNAAATTTSSCNSESSPTASQSCTHWWYFYETSLASEALPDSFYECASDCLNFAQQNNFYYQKFFSPMWINCALPTHHNN